MRREVDEVGDASEQFCLHDRAVLAESFREQDVKELRL